jgi:hypothetical protein
MKSQSGTKGIRNRKLPSTSLSNNYERGNSTVANWQEMPTWRTASNACMGHYCFFCMQSVSQTLTPFSRFHKAEVMYRMYNSTLVGEMSRLQKATSSSLGYDYRCLIA